MKKIFFTIVFIIGIFFLNESSFAFPRCDEKNINPEIEVCRYNELWKTAYEEPILKAIKMGDREFKEYLSILMTTEPYYRYFATISYQLLFEDISNEQKQIVLDAVWDFNLTPLYDYTLDPDVVELYIFGDEQSFVEQAFIISHYGDRMMYNNLFEYYGNAYAKLVALNRNPEHYELSNFTQWLNVSDYTSEIMLPYMEKWLTYILEKNPYKTIIELRRILYKNNEPIKSPVGEKFLKDFYHKALKKY